MVISDMKGSSGYFRYDFCHIDKNLFLRPFSIHNLGVELANNSPGLGVEVLDALVDGLLSIIKVVPKKIIAIKIDVTMMR